MVFRYPGGKSRKHVQQLILSYLPETYDEFREPFVGGGVFFGIDPAISKWINDRNPDLMAVYQALQDRPTDFIAACRAILPEQSGEEQILSGSGVPLPRRLHEIFCQLRDDPQADPALRYYFLHRTAYAGRVFLDERKQQMSYSNPEGWNIVTGDRLARAAQHLPGTKITCGDFAPLFLEPGNNVIIYADPPYVVDTRTSYNRRLYACSFDSMDEHERLAHMINTCPHKVCLSYGDDPFVRDLYRHHHIHEVEWTYFGSILQEKKRGKELLITNYEVSVQPRFELPLIDFEDPEAAALA